MSSEKTGNLGLHKWAPTDGVLRTEFNDNFGKIDETVAGVSSQLAESVVDVDNLKKKPTLPVEMLMKVKRKIPFPEGFAWSDAPIKIYKDGTGVISTDLDVSSLQYVGNGKTYYVSPSGSDSNDGLTSGTALRTISAARAKSDVDIIIVKAGFYDDSTGFNNSMSHNKNITIKAAPGEDVIISTMRTLTWAKTSGYTNVYNASRSLTTSVYDTSILDSFGDYTKLTAKQSIAEVDATPGSYYFSTPDLYIHTPNSRTPDTSIRACLDVKNFYNDGSYTTYLEGIKFYGGNAGSVHVGAINNTDKPIVYAKNCEFKYSSAGAGGFKTLGAFSILQNCLTSRNQLDGNNYHRINQVIPKAIEVNCVSRRNGIGRNVNTDNGSTMHEGGKIIRVNCKYYNNEGPNIHDINAESEAWNLGCECYNSVATTPLRRTNYRVEDYAKMWLDSCIGYDSDASLYGSTTCEVKIRNSVFDKDDSILGSLEWY